MSLFLDEAMLPTCAYSWRLKLGIGDILLFKAYKEFPTEDLYMCVSRGRSLAAT